MEKNNNEGGNDSNLFRNTRLLKRIKYQESIRSQSGTEIKETVSISKKKNSILDRQLKININFSKSNNKHSNNSNFGILRHAKSCQVKRSDFTSHKSVQGDLNISTIGSFSNLDIILPIQLRKNFKIGTKVIALDDHIGYYYDGIIIDKMKANSLYCVIRFYKNKLQHTQLSYNVIKANDFGFYISNGDYVMAKIINEFDEPCWAPGIVISSSSVYKCICSKIFHEKIYTVMYFNGESGEHKREQLIRIQKFIFSFAANYIFTILGKKKTSKPLNFEIYKNGDEKTKDDKLMKEAFENLSCKINDLKADQQELKQKVEDFVDNIDQKIKKINPNDQIKSIELQINDFKQINKSDDFKIGERVLACWNDDFWFYESIVTKVLDKFQFEIEDSTSDTSTVTINDIIKINRMKYKDILIGDKVVALHPEYFNSYAPGEIVGFKDGNRFLVKFYDSIESEIHLMHLFKIHKSVYVKILENKKLFVKKLLDQDKNVIAKNSNSGKYEKGKIVADINGHAKIFKIKNDNGEFEANINHIFGNFTRKRPIKLGDYVITEDYHLPGRVISEFDKYFEIKFIPQLDRSEIKMVMKERCFWLSKSFYEAELISK